MNGNELYLRFCKMLYIKDMTLKDFCEKTGVRQTALSNWKARGTMPSADLALAIAKGLDVSVDYVLGNSDIPNPDVQYDYTDFEISMIEDYRNLDEESKRQLILMIAFLKDQQDKNSIDF